MSVKRLYPIICLAFMCALIFSSCKHDSVIITSGDENPAAEQDSNDHSDENNDTDENYIDRYSCDIRYIAQIKKAADYIVYCQNSDGAISDAWDSEHFNTDNNMSYALTALYHAYIATLDATYLDVIKSGLSWLASVQDADGKWHWRYGLDGNRYVPTVDAEDGVEAVETIDAPQSFFAYNLWLYSLAGGDPEFISSMLPIAKKGIDKLIEDNLDENNLFIFSSWRTPIDGARTLLGIKYAMGQGDVYLGLKGICNLTEINSYCDMADSIRSNFDEYFWDFANSRYTIGIDRSDDLDDKEYMHAQSFPAFFMQNTSTTAKAAFKYLIDHRTPSGAVQPEDDDEVSSTTTIGGMAALADLIDDQDARDKAVQYILSMQVVADGETNGAIKYKPGYSDDNLSNLYANVTGFGIIGLCGNILP